MNIWQVLVPTVGSVIICILNNLHQNAITRTLFEYKISKLEEEVNKHNSIIERTYELEKNQNVIVERLNNICNEFKKN